jgi:hypothetical protein
VLEKDVTLEPDAAGKAPEKPSGKDKSEKKPGG